MVLDAAHRVWIECSEKKRRCLWLHGEASTGKTAWWEMFKTIFTGSYLKINSDKFQETDNRPKTQLVGLNDVAANRITSAEMASEMKNLLEGQGMSVNTKMGTKKLMFVGCHFMITSNNLPTRKILKPTVYDD